MAIPAYNPLDVTELANRTGTGIYPSAIFWSLLQETTDLPFV